MCSQSMGASDLALFAMKQVSIQNYVGCCASRPRLEGLHIASQDRDISATYTLANESPSLTEPPSVP